jgi:HSP20 family molecular chaperone IbpA
MFYSNSFPRFDFDFDFLTPAARRFRPLTRQDIGLRWPWPQSWGPRVSCEVRSNDDGSATIALAVPGFSLDELSIEVEGNTLRVSGQKAAVKESASGEKDANATSAEDERGAPRIDLLNPPAFRQEFALNEDAKVEGASLRNGVLVIEIRRVVPESKKPQKVAIKAA